MVSTCGVFPVPPTVILPTHSIGTAYSLDRKMPKLYNICLKPTTNPYIHDNGSKINPYFFLFIRFKNILGC